MDFNLASPNTTTRVFPTTLPLSTAYPFYYFSHSTVIPGISDEATSLAAPVIAYWLLSLFFHLLDISGWKWLAQYKLHESAEVKKRNMVTKAQVIKAVLVQQAFQTLLGVLWMMDASVQRLDHATEMQRLISVAGKALRWLVDDDLASKVMNAAGDRFAYCAYWWFIPASQLVFAAYVSFLFYTNELT